MNRDTLSARLKAARARVGLSQPQLAERSGVSLPNLRQLEQGRRGDPRASTLRALARALGVTIDELVG